MTPARKRLVLTLIAALLAAHLVAIAGRIDHWPLSNYDMFAARKSSTVSCLVLMGVTGRGEEFRLQDPRFWKPYSPAKLGHCLRDARRLDQRRARQSRGERPPTSNLPAVVQSLLDHYEARRRDGLHAGPQLAGLRLYDCQWRLDPSLSNLQRPDRRELVCEYAANR